MTPAPGPFSSDPCGPAPQPLRRPDTGGLAGEVRVVPADRYGIVQPRGPVTGDLIAAYGRALASHPDWRPGFAEVWDMRFSPTVDVVPSDVPTLLELERETKEALAGSWTVAITPRPFLLFSVQFYARLVKPLGRTVLGVATAEEAADLLGIAEIPDLRAG